jgi:beta-carotene 3-hydroxylase
MIYFYNLCSSKLVTHYVWNDEPIAWYTWVGFGILLYGLAYFIVHDLIIHQRFKVFTKTKTYMF